MKTQQPRANVADQVAFLVADLQNERDELLRAHVQALPETVARELYQRGYRAGYSAGRRTATRRGPYRKTRELIGD